MAPVFLRMTHVATLISNPGVPALEEAVLTSVRGKVRGARSRWLAPGIAADVCFTPEAPGDERMLAEELRSALATHPVDVVVQRSANRRKQLLVADMDSTMIGQECVDELADKVGLKSRIAVITERAMNGEIAFEPALRERVALLRGLPLPVIDEVLAERIRISPGALTLVHTMRAHGAYTCLVSGGFTLFTDRVAAMIGFHENRANRLIVEAGRIEGVEEPILGRDAKLSALLDLTAKLGLAREDTLAVGDGANDLAMLKAAGLGVAYRAKPKVAASAQVRIDHGDLTALLYVQGYRSEEFTQG
jgi:phosphoserine phosphatase